MSLGKVTCFITRSLDGRKHVLQRLEEELWREETRFDLSRMEEVIAEDFFEFGRSING